MHLELSEAERAELLDLVRCAYGDTNPEIHRARTTETRAELHERRDLLARLLERLQHAEAAGA